MKTTIVGTMEKNAFTMIPYVVTEKGSIQPMVIDTDHKMVSGIPNGTTVILTTEAPIVHLRSNGEELGTNAHRWLRTPIDYHTLPERWDNGIGEPVGHYLQIDGDVVIEPIAH